MTGINQGTPEAAIGEPIRLGSNNEFEIEQHPVSDRLIIRDTVNGKVAYIRAERGGQIGGDGVLVKALKEGKPMADDGRTYDTIQQAERAASSWVFVPPGTFTENPTITTDGLTLRGSGYNTLIDGQQIDHALTNKADNVTIENLSVRTGGSSNNKNGITNSADDVLINSVTVREAGELGIRCDEGDDTNNVTVVNCTIGPHHEQGISPSNSGGVVVGNIVSMGEKHGIHQNGTPGAIIANNIVDGTSSASNANGIRGEGDSILIGNRIISASEDGIKMTGDNSIIANNRISDSGNSDIDDNGTGTVLDANLTGASN